MKRCILFLLTAFFFTLQLLAQEDLMIKYDSLYAVGEKMYEAGKYEEAIPIFTKSADNFKKIVGENHIKYASCLLYTAFCYNNISKYKQSLPLLTKYADIYKNLYGERSTDYANILHIIASIYYTIGNNKAIEIETKASEIWKEILGEKHPDYATSLSNLAQYYSELGNYNKAIETGTQALGIWKEILGEKHPNYAVTLSNLASYYSGLGNYNKAIEIGTQALKIRKEVLSEKHPDYAISLNNLSNYYSDLGDYNKAIQLGTQALEIRKEVLSEKHPDYAISLNNLATYYSSLGDYNKAIQLGTQALEINKKVLGEEHPNYVTSLINLTDFCNALGNYNKAIEFGTLALDINKNVLEEKHPAYSTLLANLTKCYYALGNYNKAIQLETKALGIIKEVLGEKHPKYANSLNNLANYYCALGNYNKAIQLETQALEIDKEVLGEKHPDYTTSLNNLASYYYALGNYNKAIQLGTQALGIIKEIFDEKHPYYANSLDNLASYYYALRNYNKAIEIETQALNIRKEILGEKHPDYANSLCNLSEFYFGSNNLKKGSQYFIQNIRLRTKNVTNTFKDLTAQGRIMYWDNQKYIFDYTSKCAFYSRTDTALFSTAYNAVLLSKGLLLNSDIEFSKLIADSGDTAVIQKNQQLTNIRNILNKLYEQPIDKRVMSTDSLENSAEDLEHQLVKESKIFGDYTKNMNIQWPDVQQALKSQDAAIEFTTFLCKNDSVMYAALVLRKDSKCPVMIPLFEKTQIDSLSLADQLTLKEALTGISDKKKYIYNNVKLGHMVWQPLAEQLNGVKNIYFAPSGILHQIAIEYLPLNDSVNIASKYNLYRLSSTRQLALIHDRESIKSAALYGGLIYDMDSTMLIKKHKLYEDKIPMLASRDVELIDTLSQRFGLDYLRGTLIEVNEIDNTLKQGRIPTQYYTDINGTEESVKVLSGKRINLLHIATHGFYWTPQKAKRMEHLGFLQASNSKNDTEDQSLTRSGLLFAGANLAWNGKEVPTGIEDGILTSKELSQLDLRGLDLVVMSACQTGLGEITGEGVFGLQRGFKKAGANTLVMSLWKVDDKATEVMMSQFYKNLMTGQNKRQAFLNAQQYLRNYSYTTDKDTVIKFDDPKYWAAFIMLDGN